jgi:hypothetical protein
MEIEEMSSSILASTAVISAHESPFPPALGSWTSMDNADKGNVQFNPRKLATLMKVGNQLEGKTV